MRRTPNLRIVPHARRWAVVSALLVLLALGALVGRGLELSLDFVGGSSFRVEGIAADVDAEDERLVAQLPVALANGSFRTLVDNEQGGIAAVAKAIAHEEREDVLERVHSLLGYVGKGYVHKGQQVEGALVVPHFLSDGWLAVSNRFRQARAMGFVSR